MVSGRDAFDEIADELYGLPLNEFTAARTAAAGRAGRDGDRDLATRIGGLRKPTVVGWLANQLARSHSAELVRLVELGESLRDAMRRLDGDEIRRYTGRQQEAVYALVDRAVELAGAAGQKVSGETKRRLADTLHAALADPAAAAELRAGRLTDALYRTGFPELLAGEPAQPPQRTPVDRAARRDEERARAEAERTADAHARAQRAAEESERAVRLARERVDRLREELDRAVEDQATAEAGLRRARRDAREADQAARLAARRLAQTADRRDDSGH